MWIDKEYHLNINKTGTKHFCTFMYLSYINPMVTVNYRRVSKVAALATFEISDLKGRLLSGRRLLSEGAYFQVVIFGIGYTPYERYFHCVLELFRRVHLSVITFVGPSVGPHIALIYACD